MVQLDKAEAVRTQGLNEARHKARYIYDRATASGDLANANRAVEALIRIEQVECGVGMEKQRAGMYAFPLGLPLPGKAGGPPLTDQGRKYLEEIEKLSVADRMVLRENYSAMIHVSQLEARRREGKMSDLLREQPKRKENE